MYIVSGSTVEKEWLHCMDLNKRRLPANAVYKIVMTAARDSEFTHTVAHGGAENNSTTGNCSVVIHLFLISNHLIQITLIHT